VTCPVLSIIWQAIAANGVPYRYWPFYPASRAVDGVGGTVIALRGSLANPFRAINTQNDHPLFPTLIRGVVRDSASSSHCTVLRL